MHGITTRPVRPRNAASLILLREGTGGPEVLLGRRGATARFMPGNYVFPGGGVQRADARPWHGEAATAAAAGLRITARAALRETFEETGFIVGRMLDSIADVVSATSLGTLSPVERAYREQRLTPAIDALVQVGRAITPTFSPIRFHARFFVADGALAVGPLHPGEELDAVGWYALADGFPAPMSDVTRFMLEQGIAAWRGRAAEAAPLYRYVKGVARVEWETLAGRVAPR